VQQKTFGTKLSWDTTTLLARGSVHYGKRRRKNSEVFWVSVLK